MKIIKTWPLVGLLAISLAVPILAQTPYPKYSPKPKPSPSAAKTPTNPATPTPDASTPTPDPTKPTGPLKIITTDGHNKDSPIKILALNYYDSGYGKYNSETRVSCRIQNSSKTAELKKVTLFLQIVNGDKRVVQEWKVPVGTMKPNAIYDYNPPVWYNTLGVVLHGNLKVTHEEISKEVKPKAGGKPK